MSKKPVQDHKQTRAKTSSRRSKWIMLNRERLRKGLQISVCKETGEVKRRHFATPEAGLYRGNNIRRAQSEKDVAVTPEKEVTKKTTTKKTTEKKVRTVKAE